MDVREMKATNGCVNAGAALIVFAGEYDLACKTQLREELKKLYFEPNVVIDLTNVTYLDCTCITEFLRMHDRRDASGFERETVILRRPIMRRLFDALDMQRVFRIVDSLDEAVDKRDATTSVRYAFCGGEEPVAAALPYAQLEAFADASECIH